MMTKPSRLVFSLLFLAACFGMAMVLIATVLGPGVGGDATIYLTSARNLILGQGLGWAEADGSFRLLPYTPPFYPLALAGLGIVMKDMLAGARWLNVLLFGATIFLLGAAFYRYTRRTWLAVLLSGVLAASPVILGVQVWAMSESLFLFLGFAGLLLLLEYFDCPRVATLLGASVLCGLAILTRYIGVAFVATGALALLLLNKGPDRRVALNLRWTALREALLFGILAILPMIVWLVIDFSATGTVGSRSAQPAAAYWQRFLEMGPALQNIVLFWLLPDSIIARLPGFARLMLWALPLAALVGLSIVLALRLGASRANHTTPSALVTSSIPAAATRLAVLFGLFVLVFMVVLAVVQVFTFPPITLASRMLSPVHLAVLVLVFALLHLGLELFAPGSRLVLALVYLGCLGLFGMYALRGVMIARDYQQTGIGYMSRAWQESGTIEALRHLDAKIPLISNETTAVMFFLNRPAYPLQEIYQDQALEAFTAYGSGNDPGQVAFRDQNAALVLFNSTLVSDFAMYGDRAEERIQALTKGLFWYYQGEDGGIYFAPRPPLDPSQGCH